MDKLQTYQIGQIVSLFIAGLACIALAAVNWHLLKKLKHLKKRCAELANTLHENLQDNAEKWEYGRKRYLEGRKEEAAHYVKYIHTLSGMIHGPYLSAKQLEHFSRIITENDSHVQELEAANAENEFVNQCVQQTLKKALDLFEQWQNNYHWLHVCVRSKELHDAQLQLHPAWQASLFRLLFTLLRYTREEGSTTQVEIEATQLGNRVLIAYTDVSIYARLESLKRDFQGWKELSYYHIICSSGQTIQFAFPIQRKESVVTSRQAFPDLQTS